MNQADSFDVENFSKFDDQFIEEVKNNLVDTASYERIQTCLKGLLTTPEKWMYHALPLLIKPHPCLADFSVEAIGSSSEGLALTEYSEDGFNEEIDLTLILKRLKVSENQDDFSKEHFAQIIPSEKYPGHVFVKIINSKTAEFWNNLCNIVSDQHGSLNEFFITPEAVTDEFYHMMCYRHSMENMLRVSKFLDKEKLSVLKETSTHTLLPHLNDMLNEFVSDDSNTRDDSGYCTMFCREGPALKTTLFFEDRPASLQYDCAVAIQCVEWPSVAADWAVRKRDAGWPPPDLINDITANGCLIVPKTPTESKTRLEWRLSFCLAERKLMRSLSPSQKLCYAFLKSIWRKFLKPPAGKALQSYHLKNILLWECELVPVDKWSRATMTERIFGLLFHLKSRIDQSYCPHFIIVENNLFQDIDKDVLCRAGERVETCIKEANVLWIENTSLFGLLSREKTRLGMKAEMVVLYRNLIDQVCKAYLEYFAVKEQKIFELKIIDLKRDAALVQTLQKIIGSNKTKLVIELVNKTTKPNEGSLIRRYMCSRGSQKQLYLYWRSGHLDFISSAVSALTAWTELTELVTKIDILKSQNFMEFGFSSEFASSESLFLIIKFIVDWTLNNGGVLDENELIMLEVMDLFDVKLSDNMSDEVDSDIYEDRYTCDKCLTDINGVRYHCTECEDYNLCKACFETKDTHLHEFTAVQKDYTVIYSRKPIMSTSLENC